MPGGSFTLNEQPTHSTVIAIGQGVENFACRIHKYQMVTGVALSDSHIPVSYECYVTIIARGVDKKSLVRQVKCIKCGTMTC
jgi:hypothetical protein